MPRAVLAALFPPASAVEHAQHGNMTSQCITRVTGNTASKVGHKRRKNLNPNKVIFQFIVKEDNVLGMVDDYDPLEQNSNKQSRG